MLIVSKIQRTGGSRVTVGGSDYHFEPRGPKGEHVAEVENEAHIKRLLSVPEGFEPYDPGEAKDIMPDPDPEPTPEERLESAIEPDGNDEGVDDGDDDTAEDSLENNVEPDQDDGLEDMSDLDLSHAYKDEFDAMPRKNMKRETIIRHIRKARADAEI
ncbi:hypothetical protein [Roseovarius nitratireducens]|uniref:hypothetical protein n=1 Tax=Roseovarius nitratireducens TaxID=2044597 RepID=UPI000CE28426|nr:hypothetical protein [Roseovarius nitratireducens]